MMYTLVVNCILTDKQPHGTVPVNPVLIEIFCIGIPDTLVIVVNDVAPMRVNPSEHSSMENVTVYIEKVLGSLVSPLVRLFLGVKVCKQGTVTKLHTDIVPAEFPSILGTEHSGISCCLVG